jgi:hypothetical protein
MDQEIADRNPAPPDTPPDSPSVVMLSGRNFVLGCAIVAVTLLFVGRGSPLPMWLLGAEVMTTILGLFLFGSFSIKFTRTR